MRNILSLRRVWIWAFIIALSLIYSIWNAWLFDNPETWDYSVDKKISDFAYEVIDFIPTSKKTWTQFYAWHTFTDMNGDGLVDVIYNSFEFAASSNNWNHLKRMVILYNTWDYNFEVWYKCVHSFLPLNYGYAWNIPLGYYGDCAE